VIRTRVGYTGGTKKDPTYYSLGDHSETVEIDFDPNVITYEELLDVFFASHDSSYCGPSRQYMSAIFFHDSEQERLAKEAKAEEEQRSGKTVATEILSASTFYLAEDYHQKYALQGDGLVMGEFRKMYPEFMDIVDSTAAARANGYLYGYGSLEQLQRELDSLGLSEEAGDRLTDRLK
jgi:peptide-methionine (S)-S-oxide reductase